MAAKIKRQIAIFIYCFIFIVIVGFVSGIVGIIISEGINQMELWRCVGGNSSSG